VVIDTSALLAVVFQEQHGSWVVELLEKNAGRLCMSTVNLAETLIHILDRQPMLSEALQRQVL
jgi:PIN domain nuclease of toxin-antitoxin system